MLRQHSYLIMKNAQEQYITLTTMEHIESLSVFSSSTFTIECTLVNKSTTTASCESQESLTTSNSNQPRWAITTDSMDDCNNIWEEKLLNTGIFSSNFEGCYYILGCPEKILISNQKEVVMSWLVENIKNLGFYAETSDNQTKVSITFPNR